MLERASIFGFSCSETARMTKFRHEYLLANGKLVLIGILELLILICLFGIVDVIDSDDFETYLIFCARMLIAAILLVLLITYKKHLVSRWYVWIIVICYFLAFMISVVQILYLDNYPVSLACLEVLCYFIVLCFTNGLFLKHITWILIV